MGVIISIPTSGRSDSWFSKVLRTFIVQGGYAALLGGLALAVLMAFSGLSVFYLQALHPLNSSVNQLEAMLGLAQSVSSTRLRAESFLVSGSAADFAAGERAFEALAEVLNTWTNGPDTLDYFAWQQLEDNSLDYLNTFRSLGHLVRSGSAAQTQQLLRQRLNEIDQELDAQVFDLLHQNVGAIDGSMADLTGQVMRLAMGLLLGLLLLFVMGTLWVAKIARQSAHTLEQITQAAQALTQGRFDTRLDVSGSYHRDLLQLMLAFNQLGEHFKSALKSELAAQEQNRLQILKLARQEQMTAILEERHRIARELHDSVKQQLFSITLSAGAALNMVDHAPKVVKTHLEHISQAGHYAQAEMTALLQELVPVSLQDKRLEEALLAYLTPLCEAHHLKLLWRLDGTNTLTITQEHALFRAVQEAVANVIRHSNATLLRISIKFGLLTHLIIEDNGQGFDPEAVPPTSTGLNMMRTRLKRAGGHCELRTSPGKGTLLTLRLDLRKKGVL